MGSGQGLKKETVYKDTLHLCIDFVPLVWYSRFYQVSKLQAMLAKLIICHSHRMNLHMYVYVVYTKAVTACSVGVQ